MRFLKQWWRQKFLAWNIAEQKAETARLAKLRDDL
jgi:hypothetical protein